jgi:hypothetical protein
MSRVFDHTAAGAGSRQGQWSPGPGIRSQQMLEKSADRWADRAVSGGVKAPTSAVGIALSDTSKSDAAAQSGEPIEAGTRAAMETHFGADFSTVRIHADRKAAESAEELNAQAFTDGESIAFARNSYQPHSSEGLHLLSHELAHVLQQRAGVPGVQLKPAAKPQPAAHKKREDAEKDLKARYGISGVADGASAWTVEDLNTTLDALAKLPAGDIAALKGVTLERAKTLSDEAGKPRDGEFAVEQRIDTDDTKVTVDKATLRLADSAFASASVAEETILHETGHAVASKPRRDAFRGELKATAGFNKKVAEQKQTAADQTATNDTYTALSGEANAISKEYDELVKQRAEAKKAGDKKALADVDAKIKDAKKRHAAKIGEVNPAEAKYKKAEAANAAAKTSMDTAEKAKDAAKKTADDTLAPSGENQRVQKFTDFVTEQKIDPISKYAKDNWPAKPEEFYADAYSLFLTDPLALKAKSEPLYDWFKKGGYK